MMSRMMIALVVCGFMASSVRATDSKRVLCFGDSITAGGQWVAEVGMHESIKTINAGRPGRKVAQAKKELAGYLDQYPDLDKIIIFLGINDLPARDPRPGDVKVAACVENMSETIDLALRRFKPEDIILVAPCTVNPDTMNAVNRKKGYHVTPPFLSEMERSYKALAKEKGVLFLSLLNVVSKGNYTDGLHPNRAGNAEIAQAISGFLSTKPDAAKKSPDQQLKSASKRWPEEVKTIKYLASIDKSQQPMLVRTAKSKEKRPLLVGLHTWSGGYDQAGGEVVYARWCIEKDWHFIHPHFRGPNWTPDACGSEKVVQDIKDAVEYMKTKYSVDTDRIYLAGVSGGGHAAILMAGRTPEIWAGVSAWVPISDIRAWWEQTQMGRHSKYATHIEQAVGGRPDQDRAVERECARRSPLAYLDNAAGVNLDINAGLTDGHTGGSVPFTHSLYAFNQVVPQKNQIPASFIKTFYENQKLPAGFQKADTDPLYGEKRVIFRKVSKNTRVTIFQGRHEIIHKAALNWLSGQRKGRSAVWDITASDHLETTEGESQSGK